LVGENFGGLGVLVNTADMGVLLPIREIPFED